MKTKLYWLFAAALAFPFAVQAEPEPEAQPEAQPEEVINEVTIFERITKVQKKSDKFNLFFNMHGDFESNWTDGTFDGGRFQMKQFRIEAKGNINSWLRYRYRQRLTKTQEPGSMDNLAKAIDIAAIGVNLGKWDFFIGKQCASYGGIEFDLNPIEIYQYSDMVDYMSNFLTGVNIAYNFTPNQQLQFQVLDALNGSSQEMYGAYTPSKMPLVYTLNWNGNFCDVYKTRWSASMMEEVKGEKLWYFALGNDFKITDRMGAYFDWMYSREGVDRQGIMTEMLGNVGIENGGRNVKNAVYNSFVLHLNYFITPKWNIFAKLMYETAGFSKDFDLLGKGTYRTSLGYIGGIEFYPLRDGNLHFFATYVGRDYKYADRAKALGLANYDTNRLSVGFIWQMPVF